MITALGGKARWLNLSIAPITDTYRLTMVCAAWGKLLGKDKEDKGRRWQGRGSWGSGHALPRTQRV